MRRMLLGLVLVLGVALTPPAATAQEGPDCPDLDGLEVPGAEYTQAVCLDDLTTLGNTRTDTGGTTGAGTRENGSLHSGFTEHPDQAVPGVQIEGWFPDSCDRYAPETNTFIPSCPTGMRHNSQFVIRIPNDWDGHTLVVAGTPGIRTQFSSDIAISDRALVRGWAYASQDKGNTGFNFFRAGDTETDGNLHDWVPAEALQQWSDLMALTALGARGALEQLHGSPPARTYATGISNGGYQTRLALEHHPDLFDGGVDWEGTLFRPEGPNLFTYLPPILRNYHAARGGSPDAYRAMVHEGRLPPWSEPVWDYHYAIYWGLTQRIYRQAIDPEYTSYAPNIDPVLLPVDPDAQYEYHARPDFVAERIATIENSGDIHGKPLITLHPDLDALLPISTSGDVYADLVRGAGHGDVFRYYVVEGGTHVDTLTDNNTDRMRPVLPCFLEALDALDEWVRTGSEPPPSGLIGFPAEQTPEDRANTCALPEPVERAAGPTRVETAVDASRRATGITETAVIASAGDFPDALAAAPFAARLGATLLLVGDELDDAVVTELERIGAVAAIVVGGSAAVSEEVVAELEALGLAVRRIAGQDRYATAAAIADEVDTPDRIAFVSSGERFPDALSVAPVAAALRAPILLTRQGTLPEATAESLRRLSVHRTVVAGGTGAVSDAVAARLPEPRRLSGADRYGTNLAVAGFAQEHGLQTEHLHVATGRNFPDALAAGPVAAAGQRGALGRGIILLVDGQEPDRSPMSFAWLTERGAQVRHILVYGGSAAVSEAAAQRLDAALQ